MTDIKPWFLPGRDQVRIVEVLNDANICTMEELQKAFAEKKLPDFNSVCSDKIEQVVAHFNKDPSAIGIEDLARARKMAMKKINDYWDYCEECRKTEESRAV